jgi:site-specific DNA-adenine methylase
MTEKRLKAFKYAGSKEFCIDKINEYIDIYCKDYKRYYELFVGSGSVFYNLIDNKLSIINDLNFSICYMHNAIKEYTYVEYEHEYNNILKTYGDIKNSKESYYNFRDDFNKRYWKSIQEKRYNEGGLWLLILSSSCINSMLRFGPNRYESILWKSYK